VPASPEHPDRSLTAAWTAPVAGYLGEADRTAAGAQSPNDPRGSGQGSRAGHKRPPGTRNKQLTSADGSTTSRLPSWPCRFDPGHPLHVFPQVNRPVSPSGEGLEEPPEDPLNPFSTPVFPCVGHEWVTPLVRIQPGEVRRCAPRGVLRDPDGSRSSRSGPVIAWDRRLGARDRVERRSVERLPPAEPSRARSLPCCE
jgi:hypothetical protein